MKNVLFICRQYRRELHQAVADYARMHHWLLEYFPFLPARWQGDGILADQLDQSELKCLRHTDCIPIVVQRDCPGERVGKVFEDADAIATMAVNYFQERGFRHVAAVGRRSLEEADHGGRFVDLARSRGIMGEQFCWAMDCLDDDWADALLEMRKFVRALPKPCALFLGEISCANVVFRACALEDIAIPRDLAILTNDDDPLVCETFRPMLSGISGEMSHVGLAMARMLNDMMSSQDLQPTPLFIAPGKVVARQSTDVLAIAHVPTTRAINYIYENYSKLIGVEEISRQAGLSLNALQQNFREHTGKLPSIFLRDVRLSRAKELLEETDSTLSQIAKKTGYSCAMTLYTAFKRESHMTPGAYRRQSRPGNVKAGGGACAG